MPDGVSVPRKRRERQCAWRAVGARGVVALRHAARLRRHTAWHPLVMVARSVVLFALAAVAEIGGAYLMWIGLRDGRGAWAVVLGGAALVAYGAIASLQSSNEFGRVLAAYGGVFIVGSLAWGAVFDGFRPDRFDVIGAAICLIGVGVLMYAPRA